MPADGFRDVPDIALSASPDHDPYLICSAGWCTNGFRDSQTYLDVIGGTSAAVPTFAGIVALINQKTAWPPGQYQSGAICARFDGARCFSRHNGRQQCRAVCG